MMYHDESQPIPQPLMPTAAAQELDLKPEPCTSLFKEPRPLRLPDSYANDTILISLEIEPMPGLPFFNESPVH